MNLNEKTCPKPKTSPAWKGTLLKVQNGPEVIPSTLGPFLSYEKSYKCHECICFYTDIIIIG